MAVVNGSRVVAGVPDLFFASKIAETARQAGVTVEFAASTQALLEKTAEPPALLILDLGAAVLEPLALIARLRAAAESHPTRVVAFVSHERTDLIEQARQAGCDEVMTRGAFAKSLPGMLTELAPRSV